METKRLFWMLLTLIIASQYTGMNYYLIKCMPEYVRYNIRKINRNATICSYRFGMENGNSLEKNVVCDNGMLFYPSFNRMCFWTVEYANDWGLTDSKVHGNLSCIDADFLFNIDCAMWKFEVNRYLKGLKDDEFNSAAEWRGLILFRMNI